MYHLDFVLYEELLSVEKMLLMLRGRLFGRGRNR